MSKLYYVVLNLVLPWLSRFSQCVISAKPVMLVGYNAITDTMCRGFGCPAS